MRSKAGGSRAAPGGASALLRGYPLVRDPHHLGAEIGFLAVLHTWGQTLHHHPHLHCVVPGGGLSLDGAQWRAWQATFFLPVRVLSRVCAPRPTRVAASQMVTTPYVREAISIAA